MKLKLLLFAFISYTCQVFAQNTLSYTHDDVHYNKGFELYQKKAYAASRNEFHEFIRKSESSLNPNKFNIANAEYYAAVSSLNSKSQDADIEVSRFVLKNPDHPKAKLIYGDFAKSYFDKEDYVNAIKYYNKALENRSDNLSTYDLRYYLGVSYYMQNDMPNALKQFNVVKATSAENAINAAYYAGVINFQNNNLDEALTDLRRVENVNPYKMEVPNWIAQILFRQNKYSQLLAYTEPIIANPNGRKIDDLCLLTAEVYFFQNNFEKSAYYYEKFKGFRRGITSDQITFRHAYSLYKIENYESASTLFKQLAVQNSEIGQQSAYYLGISSLKNNDLNSSLAAFETAKKLNFDRKIKEDATFSAIKVLVEKNNSPQAVLEIQQYLKDFPNGKYEDEANELLSDIFYESNNYVTAIRYIESLKRRTAKIDAAYQKLCYSQGIVDYNGEKYENAYGYFNKALSQPSDAELNTQAKFWKAESASQLNKPETEGLYRELAQSGNEEIKLKSIYNVAYINFNAKKYSEASKYFSDFLNQNRLQNLASYQEDALLRLADCYLVSKDFGQALKIYDQAYQNNVSGKDYALFQKGITLKNLDKDAEAKQIFEQFSKNYSDSRLIDAAMYQNAVLEMDKSNYANAVTILSDLLRKKPNSTLVPEVLLKRALSYSNLQNNDSAILDYKLILSKYGNSSVSDEALLGIKDALNAQNRSEEFYDIAEQFKKNNPESGSVTNLQYDSAKDLYYAEKYDKAIAALKTFIKGNPQSSNVAEANYLIAESNYILNNKPEALKYYQTIIDNNQVAFLSKSAARTAAIYFDSKNYDKAAQNYQTVISSTSNEREILLAKEGLYMSDYYLGNYDKTLAICNQILLDGGKAVVGSENKAQLFIAKSQMMRKEYNLAKASFEKTLKMGKDINGAEAKYSIGEIQYKLKEYDASIKTLQDLSQQFGEFVTWYEKGFLLIADNYIAKNDVFMAKATLNSIIENSDNAATVDTAKQKLNAIK